VAQIDQSDSQQTTATCLRFSLIRLLHAQDRIKKANSFSGIVDKKKRTGLNYGFCVPKDLCFTIINNSVTFI